MLDEVNYLYWTQIQREALAYEEFHHQARARSLLARCTLNWATYITQRVSLSTSLFGRHESVFHCPHHMFFLGACSDCWLTGHQKGTKQISKQKNLARAKSNSQSLSWTYSKQGKKTEAYKNAKDWMKPSHCVQKFLCMDETPISTCPRPARQGRLTLGSCVPEKWRHNLPCLSIQVSPAPWSLESSNRFPQPWQQFYAWV